MNKDDLIIVAFGANLGPREATIDSAILLIASRIGPIVSRSPIYHSAPLNHPDSPNLIQPEFLNGALRLITGLDPYQVLENLLEIEVDLGRKRDSQVKWGPRTIDLDLIAWGDRIISSPGLTLPHPELHRRLFVLEPMLEIAPDWVHPVLKKTVKEMTRALRRCAA